MGGQEPQHGARSEDDAPESRVVSSQEAALRALREELDATRAELARAIAELAKSAEELRQSHHQALADAQALRSANEELTLARAEIARLEQELANADERRARQIAELDKQREDVERSLARARRTDARQHMMIELGRLALTSDDAQVVRQQAVRELCRLLDVDLCGLFELQDGEPGAMTLTAAVGYPADAKRASVPTSPDHHLGWALMRDGPTSVDHLQTDPRLTPTPLLVAHGAVSGISCAVRIGDDRFGVLAAHARTSRRFDAEDVELVAETARIVASALHRRREARASSLLRAEHTISTMLAEAGSIDDVASPLLDTLRFAVDAVFAELWRPADGVLRCVATSTDEQSPGIRQFERSALALKLAWGQGLPGRVADAKRLHFLTSIADEPEFARRAEAELAMLRSACAFPLLVDRRTVGVIALYWRETSAPSDGLGEALVTIGRHVAETERRLQTERQLRHSEMRLKRTVETAQIGILFAAEDGSVIDCNPSLARMLGYDPGERPCPHLSAIFADDYREKQEAWREHLRRYGTVEAVEVCVARNDGARIPALVTISHLGVDDEYVVFVVELGELERARHSLEQANRHKDAFLAMLGHELRNPLAALSAAVQLQRMIPLDDDRFVRTRGVIERQTALMTKLIDGLLDLSRIARGKIQLERVVMDLRAPVRAVFDDQRSAGEQKGLEMRLQLCDTPVWVDADPTRIAQVVSNLVHNAIKFTSPPGEVLVAVKSHDGRARLTVRDTGIGIEPSTLPRLFEPFQGGKAAAGGLGLGLSLVKGLVELHGGAVKASSEGKGRGAQLDVELPLVGRPPASRGKEGTRRKLRMLVVEDNEDTAEMLRDVLEMDGHEVTVAYDGTSGVERARELKPEVVFCDIGLPDMSGYDVARAIRADAELAHAYLVALTGYGRQEDRERAQEAGFDTHLTKPVDLSEIEQVLADQGGDETPSPR